MADVVAIRIKADAKQAKKELKGLGGSLDSAGKASVAAGVAFAAAGAAIIAMGAAAIANAKGIAKMGDEIAKTARIVGVSGEQFQVLRFAAERSGVAMGSVTSGMKRLARSMFDAQNGSKQIRDTFIGMGIAFEDSNGELRDSYDVLQDVAERMKKVGVTTRTTAEAQVILGRSGADLTNLLIGGKAALVGYEETLRTLGGVMSEETLKASEDYEDSVTDLKAAITGLRIEMGAPLLDVMTEFNEKAAGGTSGLKNLAAGFGELSASVLQFSLDVGSQVLDDIFGDDPNKGLGGAADVAARKARREAQQARDLARSTAGLTGFFGGGETAGANGPPVTKTGPSGPPKTTAAVAAAINMPTPIDTSRVQAEIEAAQTEAHLAGIAERFMWDKADFDQRVELQRRLRDEFRMTQDAQIGAAQAAFASIEQFAGMAQSAVEDSYFGQTKAGRAAAKALFVAGKAAALANAIVNTAQAVTNALAVQPYPLGAALAVSAGIAGGTQIGTIVGTTIQGLADAGLAPGALRDAGLHGHTAIAISPGEAVIDPVGTAEISRMLALQRRQMEMAAQGGANGGPIVVVAELDGRRVSRGLSGPMTSDLEDGYDFRRNVRMEVG